MVKKNLLLALLVVFILSCLSTAALAADDVEWVEKLNDKKLYWGDSVTVGGYVVKAEDFHDEGTVFVTISKDGEELKSGPLAAGLELEYDDEIKVYAQKVDPNYEIIKKNGVEFKTDNWNPYAQLDILLRGKPGFDIDVDTDQDSYDPKSASDSRIDVTINVKNDGDAKAENVVLTIDTAGLEVISGKTKYTYTKVLKGEALEPITLTLKTPAPWEDTNYKIIVKTEFEDFKGEEYEDEGSKTIKIKRKWDLIVSKSATKERHMGEPVYVSMSVRNGGLCAIKDIELTDTLVSGMRLEEDIELGTTLSLEAGEVAADVFKYTLIPEKPGTFTFPKAVATFTLPNGASKKVESDNSDKTKIYGPNIILTKSLSTKQLKEGDELTVTVTVKNSGNVDSSVTVTDTVPPEAKFISGETSYKGVLQSGGGAKKIKYILQMHNEGEIQLPPCKATFIDLESYKGEVYSDTPPVVNVGTLTLEASSEQQKPTGTTESNQEKNEERDDTHVKTGGTEEDYGDTPGFGALLAGLGLLGIAGLRKKGIV
ncbi:BatD family protein [Methanosarcina sp. Mfa9]|uniref:BatD family protein n=1 Tax=Methanosarcina sp. Mfa9 TaxID=3439063 RepID=UPI003F84FDF1